MSLGILLQAAEWLERREREAEHGYAQPLMITKEDLYTKKLMQHKQQKRQIGLLPMRTTHNELEKNRRAHLRTCLESLKEIVPLSPESNRHTTLGLLTRAKAFIKKLEDSERRYRAMKKQLLLEQPQLQYVQLPSGGGGGGGGTSGLEGSPTSLLYQHQRGNDSGSSSNVQTAQSYCDVDDDDDDDVYNDDYDDDEDDAAVASGDSDVSASPQDASHHNNVVDDGVEYDTVTAESVPALAVVSSDSDDISSIESNGSDGGITVMSRNSRSLLKPAGVIADTLSASKPTATASS